MIANATVVSADRCHAVAPRLKRRIIDRLEEARLYPRQVATGTAVLETTVGVETQLAAGPTTIRDPHGKRLVADCLAGDAAARARFHQLFGPLIYRFVGCVSGGSHVEPGDFYVYLFEDDRLYRRLRSYEGRASLEPFLRGFVLPDMFKRFEVMTKKAALETVSLDSDGLREPADPTASPGDPGTGTLHTREPAAHRTEVLAQLKPEKRLLVKLLYIEDFELDPDDVHLIAQKSGRAVREVIELIERARASVRAREKARHSKLEEAESAAQWILQYTRRLTQITTALGSVPPDTGYAERLRQEQAEIERKRAWRQPQRGRAHREGQRATVTLRYREIGEILNAPTGSISAQIMRLRQELLTLVAGGSER